MADRTTCHYLRGGSIQFSIVVYSGVHGEIRIAPLGRSDAAKLISLILRSIDPSDRLRARDGAGINAHIHAFLILHVMSTDTRIRFHLKRCCFAEVL